MQAHITSGAEVIVTSRSIDVGGINMRWEESGEGFPVVLVHGIPTSPALWRRVVPLLRGARSLAWEMVGYGASIDQGTGRDISLRRQADYLLAWAAELGLERVVLVGHDLGGGVAQIAAVQRREFVAGLVLTNAVGYDSWPIPGVKAMRTLGSIVERLPNPALKAVLAPFLRRGHDDQRIASESIAAHWAYYAATHAGRAFVRQIRSLDVRDTLAIQNQLPLLQVPARVVWGEADAFQKVEYGERFARDLHTELQRIPGGKHFTPEDHPDVLANAINSVVQEVAEADVR